MLLPSTFRHPCRYLQTEVGSLPALVISSATECARCGRNAIPGLVSLIPYPLGKPPSKCSSQTRTARAGAVLSVACPLAPILIHLQVGEPTLGGSTLGLEEVCHLGRACPARARCSHCQRGSCPAQSCVTLTKPGGDASPLAGFRGRWPEGLVRCCGTVTVPVFNGVLSSAAKPGSSSFRATARWGSGFAQDPT